MAPKKDSVIYIILILLIIVIVAWSIIIQLKGHDPKIAEKYSIASNDLSEIKAAVILYYCKHRRFPHALEDMVPETISQLPRDPWGNKYILTSLAWRQKDTGMDLLSMGGDGKRGGKGWKRDSISRIDLAEIHCAEKTLFKKSHEAEK
jgi:hypothetical protein